MQCRGTCLFICHSSLQKGQVKRGRISPFIQFRCVVLKPPLHFPHLLMTEVLRVFHSGGDTGLKGGQVTILEVQLDHCLIRELGNDLSLKVREVVHLWWWLIHLPVEMSHILPGNTSHAHTHHRQRHPIRTHVRYCIYNIPEYLVNLNSLHGQTPWIQAQTP